MNGRIRKNHKCAFSHTRGKARFARLPLDPFFVLRNAFSRAAGARRDKESIFNMIFEFSAVFTCYLTYYKPIAKKVGLARPPARRGRAVRAK